MVRPLSLYEMAERREKGFLAYLEYMHLYASDAMLVLGPRIGLKTRLIVLQSKAYTFIYVKARRICRVKALAFWIRTYPNPSYMC